MSETLTWYHAGLGTKTGTTAGDFMSDMAALIDSKLADANYSWQVASQESAASPLYVVLKRKNGLPGRILLVAWTSTPAGQNSAILDGNPSTSMVYCTYFPSGNVDTPSNLSVSSGAIMGDDTGSLLVSAGISVASLYGADLQPFYFDCAEGVLFGTQNPSIETLTRMLGAGTLLVDSADVAYDCNLSSSTTSSNSFGTNAGLFKWYSSITSISHFSTFPMIRTRYGGAHQIYFQAFTASGPWASQAVGPGCVLTDTTNNKAWFAPFPLLGHTKGEGLVLKLRQIAWGPGTTGQFEAYSTTGPVVQARQFNGATSGGEGHPWVTNFKV